MSTWVSFRSAEQPLLGQFSVSGNTVSTARAVAAGFPADLTQPAAMADLIEALRARALSSGESHAEPDTRSADRSPRR
ncbi:hypothetical protein [Burkholderia contaminans]|uniref:hypothetical protein n=1 Tax=Burkholderia contaminans TaxID=488447 RepID=UPI003F518113